MERASDRTGETRSPAERTPSFGHLLLVWLLVGPSLWSLGTAVAAAIQAELPLSTMGVGLLFGTIVVVSFWTAGFQPHSGQFRLFCRGTEYLSGLGCRGRYGLRSDLYTVGYDCCPTRVYLSRRDAGVHPGRCEHTELVPATCPLSAETTATRPVSRSRLMDSRPSKRGFVLPVSRSG